MNHNQESLAARAAPVVFVVLWSTGFIATKYVVKNADPLTYLTLRMAIVVGLMTAIVAVARPKWPDRSGSAALDPLIAIFFVATLDRSPGDAMRSFLLARIAHVFGVRVIEGLAVDVLRMIRKMAAH